MPAPGLGRMLWRGLRRRCPNCGAGRLFRRWFAMRERCPRCGLGFNREEGFWLGGYVVNFGVTEGLIGVVLAVFILREASSGGTLALAPVIAAAAVAAVVVPLLFFPASRTIWLAIDLALHPLDPGDLQNDRADDEGRVEG
jgi:uncharacterized protein (DUF983 family)